MRSSLEKIQVSQFIERKIRTLFRGKKIAKQEERIKLKQKAELPSYQEEEKENQQIMIEVESEVRK